MFKKLFAVEIALLIASAIGLNMFTKRYNGANQTGVDQISLLSLAVVNCIVAGWGLRLSLKVKNDAFSVLFVVLIAAIIIGCLLLLYLFALAAGFQRVTSGS